MSTVKLGIIGCGIITKRKHLPAITRMDEEVSVIAVCNRSIGKAQEVAGMLDLPDTAVWTDWEKMIAEVKELDAVLIALPIPMNHPVSKACCAAGLSVLCEKPAGMTVEEAVDTGSFSETYGVTYMTAENYHFKPRHTKAVELVQAGAIGKVHSLSWNMLSFMAVDNKYNQTQWRADNKYPGGYVLDGGVHFTHTVQMLAGPVTEVFARTASVDSRMGTLDTAFALLTHADGAVTSLNMGWRAANDDKDLRIFGSEGSLIITDEDLIQVSPSGEQTVIDPGDENSFYLMWKEFIRTVKTKETSIMPSDTPVRDVKVIMGILESGKTGKPVPIS